MSGGDGMTEEELEALERAWTGRRARVLHVREEAPLPRRRCEQTLRWIPVLRRRAVTHARSRSPPSRAETAPRDDAERILCA